MPFHLHPRLEAGSSEIGRMGGCLVLLKNNSMFPWLLVVPMVDQEIEDLHQLDDETLAEVMLAVRKVSRFVEAYFHPEKLNVACIGNIVRQMHIHAVGRSTGDPAWPGVVWAFDGKRKYGEGEAGKIEEAARKFLGRC
jgi:diadenosine tetraphosphate (Ap4A) HIT family hydrolase